MKTGRNWWQDDVALIRGNSLGGFMLTAVGNGIKSCVSPHGGDQFPSSETKTISTYFAMFYFSTNVGAFITQFLMPILRDSDCGMAVYNFGSCYQLAFWALAFILIVAALIFFSGLCFYYNEPSTVIVIVKAVTAISTAFREKRNTKKEDRDSKTHLLDYAAPK